MTKPSNVALAKSGLFCVSELSRLTGHDRKTLDKMVSGVLPTMVEDRKFYKLSDLQAGLDTKPDKDLKEQEMREKIRKLRIKNDKDEGKLVLKSEIAQSMARCLGPIDSIIEQKLVNEWPSAVAGLDVPQARVYGKRLGDDIRKCFAALAKEFPV